MNTNSEKLDDKKYIINPKSGRKILVGGKTYKQIMSENIIGVDNQQTGVIFTGETKEQAQEFKKGMKIHVGKNYVVKQRKNNIEISRRRIKRAEIIQKSQDLAIQLYNENKELFNDQMDSKTIQSIIKQLTTSKMIDPSFKNSTNALDIKLRYIVENTPDDSEDDESDSSDSEDEGDDDDLSTIEEDKDDLDTDEDVLKDTTGEIAELTKSVGDLQAS